MSKEEILSEITKLAQLAMSPREIEIILDINQGSIYLNLRTNNGHEYAKAYLKGKYILEAELNKSILNLAKQGSGPAQTMAKKLIEQQNAKEVDFE